MDEAQIEFYLRSHPHTRASFRGVFARDELPAKLEPSSIYIVNYSLRKSKGTHWILLFMTPNSVPLYFDTAGLPPFFPEFTRLLNKYPLFIYSKHQIQSSDSMSCGRFVILMAVYLSRGRSLYESRSIFSSKLQDNESVLAGKFLKEFAFLYEHN
jgi:hypothetical protein